MLVKGSLDASLEDLSAKEQKFSETHLWGSLGPNLAYYHIWALGPKKHISSHNLTPKHRLMLVEGSLDA